MLSRHQGIPTLGVKRVFSHIWTYHHVPYLKLLDVPMTDVLEAIFVVTSVKDKM